jgi:transcriptional regulator with XRE-family HTH domain
MKVHADNYTRNTTRKWVHVNEMSLDTSQISKWLKDLRIRSGLTQDQVILQSGIGRGVVTSAEQGRVPELANFLSLVAFYRAEDELGKKLRDWWGGTTHETSQPEIPPMREPGDPEMTTQQLRDEKQPHRRHLNGGRGKV